MPLIALHQDASIRIGATGSLFVVVWLGSGDLASLDRMVVEEQKLIDQYGSISVINVLTGAHSGPVGSLRERGVEIAKRFAPHLRASYILILAKGLKASLARTFIAAFTLVSPIPMIVPSDLADTVARLQAQPGQDPGIAGNGMLLQELEALPLSTLADGPHLR